MMRKERFCQCLMTNGNRTTVGFIPAAAAVIGREIKLELNHVMDPGWRVESVGTLVAKDRMRQLERQYTRQRQASDMGTKTKRGRSRRIS